MWARVSVEMSVMGLVEVLVKEKGLEWEWE
jgi:hypothetical protein